MKIQLSPQLVRQIKSALDQFAEQANQQQEAFYNSEANRHALFDYLRKEKVSEDQWVDPNIFALAFFHCNSAGLLETRPVEVQETSEERAARLEFAERSKNNFANQYRARRDEPTTEDKFRADFQAMKDDLKAQKEAAENAAIKAAEKAARDADMSGVPTVEQIRAGQVWGRDQMVAASAAQLRLYTRRSEEARLADQVARSEEQRQKWSEKNAV